MAGTRMLTVAALTCLAASQPALAQGAAKTGYDLTTNSQDTTASEHTVRYVLSLSPNPDGTATTFQLTDTLPPGTQYIHGSTHVPVDVKPSWSVDGTSFSTTEPTDTSGVTKLQFNASDYMVLKGKVVEFPAPPKAEFSGGNTGGDGYRVIPYNGNVYTIYHHWRDRPLFCAKASDGEVCDGFPYNVPATSGSVFTNPGTAQDGYFYTSGQFVEYLDRASGKLYFFAAKVSTGKPVVVCADLEHNRSCGSYEFTSAANFIAPDTPLGFVSDGGTFGTRLYSTTSDGKMLCFDTAESAPCATMPAGSTSPTVVTAGRSVVNAPGSGTAKYGYSNVLQVGNRLYWQVSTATGTNTDAKIYCFDMTSADGTCASFNTIQAASGATLPLGAFMPTSDGSGNPNGFCVARANPNSACYDLNGAVSITNASFAAYLNDGHQPYRVVRTATTPSPTFGTGTLALGTGGVNNRTVWESATTGQVATNECWDWGKTGGAGVCDGFNGTLSDFTYTPSSGTPYSTNNGDFYEAIADPNNPGCVWTLGDRGRIRSLSSVDGGICPVQVKMDMPKLTPSGSYCDGKTRQFEWDTLTVHGVTIGTDADIAGVKVTLRGADGTVVTGWDGRVFNTLSIDISAIPVLGNTASLSATVELMGVQTDPAPAAFNQTPRPYFTVQWKNADPQQACFEVKLLCAAKAPLVNTILGNMGSATIDGSHTFETVDRSSCKILTVSGNVFNDVNGNSDGLVNATAAPGSPLPSGLNAVLVDTDGKVVGSAAVDSSGAYSITSVAPATYTVVLTTAAVPDVGETAPDPALPTPWVNTGNQLGTDSGGATADHQGTSEAFTLDMESISNVNFGVEQPPKAGGDTASLQLNPGGTVSVPVPTTLFTNGTTDPDGGGVTGYVITGLPSDATSITIDGVTYNASNPIPSGGVEITLDQLSTVQVDPVDGSPVVSIPFQVIDNAGVRSPNTGAAVLPFVVPTPVPTLGIHGLLGLMLSLLGAGLVLWRRRGA